jgi:hypothetical protein
MKRTRMREFTSALVVALGRYRDDAVWDLRGARRTKSGELKGTARGRPGVAAY